MILGSMPARHWWDVEWRKEQHQDVFDSDTRPGTSPNNVWWTREMEAKWPGPFTATSRCGCQHHCLKMILRSGFRRGIRLAG